MVSNWFELALWSNQVMYHRQKIDLLTFSYCIVHDTDHRFSPSYYCDEEFERRRDKNSVSPTFKPGNICDYLPGESSISQRERNLVSILPNLTSRSKQHTTVSPIFRCFLTNNALNSLRVYYLSRLESLLQAHRSH